MQQLSLSFRPKTFDELVGQDKIIKRIRGVLEKRTPTAWMFVGETGSGKTTLARIMALSFQCKHKKEFGNPCKKCIKNKYSFDITECNAALDTGKERMEKIISAAEFYPKHGSKYKIYILDEFHKLSDHTQNMLLKQLEDAPKSTIWILCTSEPSSVIRAMWRRVKSYGLQPLEEGDIRKLIRAVLKFTGDKEDKCSPVKLTEALLEQGITSSGLVVKAIEEKLGGASYEEAAIVEFVSTYDPRTLIKSLVKGDWNGVREALKDATKEDARAIRASVSAYLSSSLIDEENMDDNTTALSKAIISMTDTGGENSTILARVRATCYQVCKIFKGNPR